MSTERAFLRFCDMQWHVDFVTFWDRVRDLKLHVWKRDEAPVHTRGTITISVCPVARSTPANVVFMDGTSVTATSLDPSGEKPAAVHDERAVVECSVPGLLLNFNHYESLAEEDPRQVLQDALWKLLLLPLMRQAEPDHCVSPVEAWQRAPYLFSLIHAFADVKAHIYHHRESFPAVLFQGSCHWQIHVSLLGDADEAKTRLCAYLVDQVRRDPAHPFAPVLCHWTPDVTIEPFTPERWQACMRNASGRAPIIGFHDVSSDSACLGWPALNFLTCVRLACPVMPGRVCLYGVRQGSPSASLYLEVSCDSLNEQQDASVRALRSTACVAEPCSLPSPAMLSTLFTATGWKSKKVAVRDLSRYRDPARRAHEDSSLNLRLMRWQQQPDLELEKLAACRVLLLGAGTLGCNVAHNLLCWGVRHMTLVDRGHVSFSNLGRQSLFTMDDAVANSHKAIAAAAALNRVIPSPHITGIDLCIHMPGHRFGPESTSQVSEEVEALTRLVQSHDVVFTLTDSREARWLPTVLAAVHGVPVVNVAIGFGGFEVQRHGVVRGHKSRSNAVPAMAPNDALVGAQCMGCYFCGKLDPVVNTTARRTLDRQCSVTRPGVSAIASAVATEMLAAAYQHPLGFLCPHSLDTRATALGAVPQMIVGEVGSFSTTPIACERGELCEACSEPVLCGYEAEGTAFLMRCLRDPDYLDTVCGVKAFRETCDANIRAQSLTQPGLDESATSDTEFTFL